FGDPPSVVAPGDRVRFEPVDALDDPAPRRVTTRAGPPAPQLLAPGLLTPARGLGGHGQRRFGVAQSGAVDTAAHAAANARLGNEPGAAALECSMAGPSLRFLRVVRFAIEGADLGAVPRRPAPGGRA